MVVLACSDRQPAAAAATAAATKWAMSNVRTSKLLNVQTPRHLNVRTPASKSGHPESLDVRTSGRSRMSRRPMSGSPVGGRQPPETPSTKFLNSGRPNIWTSRHRMPPRLSDVSTLLRTDVRMSGRPGGSRPPDLPWLGQPVQSQNNFASQNLLAYHSFPAVQPILVRPFD